MTPSARAARPPRWPGLAWALLALTVLGLAATAWLDALLRQAGLTQLVWLDAGSVPSVVAAVIAGTVGALVASAGPGTRSAGCCWPWASRCR